MGHSFRMKYRAFWAEMGNFFSLEGGESFEFSTLEYYRVGHKSLFKTDRFQDIFKDVEIK